MEGSREEILEWERRWAVPAGLAALTGAALLVASAVVIGPVNGDGAAELLRSVNEHSSSITLSSLLQALAFIFLVGPLVYLFRAAAARSDLVRTQLIGLVVAAPLFLGLSAVLSAAATNEAGDRFASGEAKQTLTAKESAAECEDEREELGAKEFREEFGGQAQSPAAAQAGCAKRAVEDDTADNALTEASLRGIATGFALAGRLGIAIALFYTCLQAMRTGLLTRFWGSLGMAIGVAALLLRVEFSVVFFLYLGLLLLGKVPGGRPPAWAAGRAVPWLTPGEKAAADLEPGDDRGEEPGGPKRKRKQRD